MASTAWAVRRSRLSGPRATLTEHPGTIAGSATCLYDCMKRAVLEMNVPLESAVRAASENPARSIGVDNDYGSLAAGRYGNVILADKELNIKAVIQKGTRIVWNKTFTWRLLTPGELTDVYLQEMRRDFPAGELKPLSMILTSEAEGLAHTWGVFDGETLAAYLLMVRPEGSSISQLDYFAVVPAYRAGGLGAKLLAALPEYEAGAQAIIIEAEMPEKAEDEAMAVRRLGFYARCGARDTGYYEHLFDAWFRILVLPCPGAPELSDKDALDALVSCYKRTISESQWRKYVQFYAPDGSLRL